MTSNRACLSASQGFTLVETLVAVLLLTTAIVGPLTIASKGLGVAIVAKDQTAAFYLAQDAMEYIRYKRDSNCLAANAGGSACGTGQWLAGLVGAGLCASNGATSCYADSLQDTVAACSGTCPVLNYDTSTKYFSYTSGTPTPQRYIRTVTITTPVGSNTDEAQITVVVRWTGSGGILRTITIRENMLLWQ